MAGVLSGGMCSLQNQDAQAEPARSGQAAQLSQEDTLKQCWLEDEELVLQGARGKAITLDFSDHCSSKAKQRQVQIERHWDSYHLTAITGNSKGNPSV